MRNFLEVIVIIIVIALKVFSGIMQQNIFTAKKSVKIKMLHCATKNVTPKNAIQKIEKIQTSRPLIFDL